MDKFSENKETPSFNYKSRVCNSVMYNYTIPCNDGKNCKFAHFPEEIIINKCYRREKCKYIVYRNNKVFNRTNFICSYSHPQESKYQFYIRVRLLKNFNNYEHIKAELERTKKFLDEINYFPGTEEKYIDTYNTVV